MDLNKRQLQILVVLRNKNHWITSEELAEALGTNKKTIQTEIKNMLAIYEKKIIIQSNKRSGYFLESIESETKQQIIQEVTKHKIYSSMDFRASTIVTYLLFQKGMSVCKDSRHFLSFKNSRIITNKNDFALDRAQS